MSDLNLKKEVTAEIIVQADGGGELAIAAADVYMSGEDDKDMVILLQDKTNPNNKIQISFTKK